MADGNVIIGVELKDDGIKKGLENLKRNIKSLEKSAEDVSFDDAAESAEKLNDETKATDKEYKKVKNSAGNVGSEVENTTKKQKETTNEVNKTKKSFEDVKKSVSEFKKETENVKKSVDSIKEKADKSFGGIKNGVKAAGAMTAAAASYAVKFNDDYKQASNSFAAQTGKSKKEMKEFEGVLKDIYKGNYGEDIADVGNSMAIVAQNARDVSPDNIKQLTTDALVLRDTFGFEVNESMRAANMLIDQFGMTGEQAFNLIAQGAQNGLDKNGDLLDSINEYSVHYKQMGMGAEEMFNSFTNGASAGTFSVYKLGDAVKEFGIRTKDNSQGTLDAFKALKLDSKKLTKEFAKGGADGKKAFNEVTTALFNMKDKVKQNEIGVALFGTMWEDLGEEGVKALSNITGEADRTKSSISEINDVRYDNLTSALAEVKRTFEVDVLQPLGKDIAPVVGNFANELKSYAPQIKEALSGSVEGFISFAEWVLQNKDSVAEAIKTVFVALGTLKTVGFLSNVIGDFQVLINSAAGAGAAIQSIVGAAGAVIGPVGWAGLAIAGIGTAAYIAAQKADEAFYNMGNKVSEAGQKFLEAKDKANLTEDYAEKWKELNDKISAGKVSGEELAAAESERKKIEEWFIQNYPEYINAEEQKNGIRQESIAKCKDYAEELSKTKRLEYENKALEMKADIPNLAAKVSSMQNENKALGEKNIKLLEQINAIKRAENAWNLLTREEKMSAEGQKKQKSIVEDLNKELGTNYDCLTKALATIKNKSDAIEYNNKVIDKNNEKIADGTNSLQTYADTCKAVIESDLGGSLEDVSKKYDLVKDALEKVQKGSQLTDEEIKVLQEAFPELEKKGVNVETLQAKFIELQTKIDEAKKAAELFGTELNGLPKNIDINIKLNVPNVPQFAKGTKSAPRGPAVVNDGSGPELIKSKDGSFRMIKSKGAALTVLDKDDTVYTAEQTRAMMNKHAVKIPHFAGGTALARDWGDITIKAYVKNVPDAFTKALENLKLKKDLEVLGEEEYYKELEKLRDKYFQKFSDKWWEYEKEIVEYQKNLKAEHKSLYDTYAKDSLEYIYKSGYENSEAMDKAIKEIELLRKYDIIDDKEYYSRMAKYRDEYFEQGTDGWWQYSIEIYEYQKEQAEKAKELKENIKKYEDEITEKLRGANNQRLNLGTEYMRKYGERFKKLTDDIKAEEESLVSSKEELYKEKYNEFGLFSAPSDDFVESKDLLRNLRKQNTRQEKYKEALQKIRERTGNDEFANELEAMGIGEYQNIAAIARMTDPYLKDYLRAWEEKKQIADEAAAPGIKKLEEESKKRRQELKDEAEKEFAEYKKEYLSGVKDLEESIKKEFESIMPEVEKLGEGVALGIVEGIENKSLEVSKALTKILRGALEASKEEMDINSPSRVMKNEVGIQMGAGINDGLIESIGDIDAADMMKGLANAFSVPVPRAAIGYDPVINNSVTISGASGDAVLEVDGTRLGRVLYPKIKDEERRIGTKLIT